eukprot:4508359-Amphidinium_carterae.3
MHYIARLQYAWAAITCHLACASHVLQTLVLAHREHEKKTERKANHNMRVARTLTITMSRFTGRQSTVHDRLLEVTKDAAIVTYGCDIVLSNRQCTTLTLQTTTCPPKKQRACARVCASRHWVEEACFKSVTSRIA